MLEIRNITKIYETDGLKQKALDSVSVNFRKNEFASILGPSGSGKTTFLNIIGGLDHYTSGDLIINGTSTKKFKDTNWDSYRNHRIGFVFQSYNLISHQSILANVKLALTLSGVSKSEATRRAKKALKDVGLEKHINKRPNQLSGGQMQRVAIARALVNDPEILLADEPTGALDSETSLQIMELLKNIAKTKLVIMVTHNPELAEQYSSRIIKIKDGKIISDSNPFDGKDSAVEETDVQKSKSKKTNMSFITALSLSFNNLMTKKARTILVAFAGSIGIIGVALILALSTGFKGYVDGIQEDTLTSYPLTIMQEEGDSAAILLSLTADSNENDGSDKVKEQQYISSMLSNISTNDLKSFKRHIEDNYSEIKNDISAIEYFYSVEPLIYTVDASDKLTKLSPNNLFGSMNSGSLMSAYSSFTSVYQQMMENKDVLNQKYDVLMGRWPEKYNEMIVVLPDSNSISDLLVYSLGFRDYEELTTMIKKIMNGETVDINNEPLELTYEDLMNVKLKLINQTDIYKYNEKYDIYEDMSKDMDYMNKLYESAEELKIVGIVTAKEGVTSMTLSPGVAYTSDLISHIIETSKNTDIVKRQLENEDIDIFSGSRFEESNDNLGLDFSDFVDIDNNKLQSAFNINIDQKQIEEQTQGYMKEIANSVTTDIKPAQDDFMNNLNILAEGILREIEGEVKESEVEETVENYLNATEPSEIIKSLEDKYIIPADTFKTVYRGLLKGLLQAYINAYNAAISLIPPTYGNTAELQSGINIMDTVLKAYVTSTPVQETGNQMASAMTEAVMKKVIITKVVELTNNLTNAFATSLNVDQDKIQSAFKMKITDEEIKRLITTLASDTEKSAKVNLTLLGYQDIESPTYISFYFSKFEGKEHFLNFIDSYNSEQEEKGNDDKVINYTDTTGILMKSVKNIVDAVSYVLIAFVSISLIVSSIMIGVITYISVYERTKEIGILRAIGASKYNISSIFNAETFIIGLLSGLIGIGITYALIPLINLAIHHYTGNIPLDAMLSINSAGILIVISVVLTLISGFIPAKKASKKDPVEALRSE